MDNFYEMLACAFLVYIIQYCEYLFKPCAVKHRTIKTVILALLVIIGLTSFGRLAFLSVITLFDNAIMGGACVLAAFVVFRQFALSIVKCINNLYCKPKRARLSDEEYEDLEKEQMELIQQLILKNKKEEKS